MTKSQLFSKNFLTNTTISSKSYFQFETILLFVVENSFWLWKLVPVLYIGFFILSTFFIVFFQFNA